MPGPDFPTGGVIVEPAGGIQNAYETGRGSIRLRAYWEKETLSHGLYQIVVKEIPYQVQKSRLIEKIADLYKNKKLPFLGGIRDESTEEIRLILEPKSRSIDPEMLMESLFKVTDLETRFNLNMNVLTAEGIPQVMNLREVLGAFLNHRHEVLIKRTQYRLDKIAHRLEVLAGLLICYLNLDEVIRIIREEDDAKAELMRAFELTEVQVEAILNTRLRSLRKLEEMEIKREHKELSAEQKRLKALLKDESLRWEAIGEEIKDIKKRFGGRTALGARRTRFAEAPVGKVIDIEAFVEKEPVTVLLSSMGWIRAVKGHVTDFAEMKHKEGDSPRFGLHAQTTDKLLLFASNGRFYTLSADKLPKSTLSGKGGFGDSVRVLLDMDGADIVSLQVYDAEQKLLLASNQARGFVIDAAEVMAQTRSGKQILSLPEGAKAAACVPVDGDMVAVIGENRKLLLFPLDQVPVMKKGQGVGLQKYKDKHGRLADIKTFHRKDGLTWAIGERTRSETDIKPWAGNRNDAGRLPPTGFPRTNRFF